MPLLDAALAYALTMLLFATVVSAIVGSIYHLLGLREKGLKQFLQHFFVKELSPSLHSELNYITSKTEKDVSSKLQTSVNEMVKTASEKVPDTNPQLLTHLLNKADTHQLVSYSTDEFISELKTSDFGKQAVKDLKEHSDELFERIAKRYETFGEHFRGVFKKKLHIVSTIIGVFLAYAINVDAIHLIATYMSNNQVSAQIVNTSQQSKINSLYQAQNNTSNSTEPQQAMTDMDNAFSAVDELQADSFPIGWSLFPHCPPHSADYRCEIQVDKSTDQAQASNTLKAEIKADVNAEEQRVRSNVTLYITWFLGCLITGLLSGLGAPFWYDAVRRIGNVGKQMAKS
jgi:hypothetical protein